MGGGTDWPVTASLEVGEGIVRSKRNGETFIKTGIETMNGYDRPAASLGAVFQASWRTYLGNFPAILAFVLIIDLPIDLMMGQVPLYDDPASKEMTYYLQVSRVLDFWIGTIRDLGIIQLTAASFYGEKLAFSNAFANAFSNYGRALVALFLSGLVIFGCMLLLILPGIAAAIYLSFILHAIVFESVTGTGSLNSSYEFVKGRWWPMMLRVTTINVLILLLSHLSVRIAIIYPNSEPFKAVMLIPTNLLVAFGIICTAQLYALSRRGDGGILPAPAVPEAWPGSDEGRGDRNEPLT